jgi:hypothetical protein
VTRVASLLSALPGSWLAPPPLMGGLRPGITSWVVRLNALIRSSLNRQLCELPAASPAAVQQALAKKTASLSIAGLWVASWWC